MRIPSLKILLPGGILFAGKKADELQALAKQFGLTAQPVKNMTKNLYKLRKQDAYYAFGSWENVSKHVQSAKTLRMPVRFSVTPLSKFPAVSRDISFIVDSSARNDEIKKTISQVSEAIYLVELFDEFSGSQIGAGKKSLAFHIHYQNREKTMTSAEIQLLHEKVARLLQDQYNALVR